MRGNPFDYQRPLPPGTELVGRRTELDALQRAAADRVAVRLVSPRRFGKTSLLRAHLSSMRDAGHRACYVDFDRVATLADVVDRLVDGLRQLPADPERRLERRLDRLGVSIGTTGLSVAVAPRVAPAALTPDRVRAVIRDLLALPGELSSKDGGLTVVALDEFQDLLTADDRLDGLFRSVLQHQQDVAHVFAGSAPTLMKALFAERERPFYGQARPLDLPGLPEDEALAFVLKRLPEHPQRSAAAAGLVRLGAGHPQRTMLLAHHLYDRLDAGSDTDDVAAEVLHIALAELDDAFLAVWAGLDRTERSAVVALADGVSPVGSRAAAEHAKPRSTLQRAVERLEADGQLVVRESAGLRLLDPLLAEWLRRR